jgi:acetoin utilization deacetylase AcuC-like enzyme
MRCSAITGTVFSSHDVFGHPECNARLLTACTGLDPQCQVLPPQECSTADLERVHDRSYIAWLQERCGGTATVTYVDPDTYITSRSFEVASFAAGSAIGAVNLALSGEHCFALIRPPGHHAEHNRAMGFCLFNNAAVAAAAALKNADRIAIVDWDYHHGNGTQHTFYSSNRVLYCSVHHGGAFPYTGALQETGTGGGEGFTINAPLSANATIADYYPVFSEVFIPAILRFEPDALIISAGQDILFDDPLGMMDIRSDDFEVLAGMLAHSIGVGLALVLEGGYGPSHGEAIAAIFRGLGREREPQGEPGKIRRSTAAVISLLKKIHRLD